MSSNKGKASNRGKASVGSWLGYPEVVQRKRFEKIRSSWQVLDGSEGCNRGEVKRKRCKDS